MATETLPSPVKETETRVEEAFEKNWNVIVWNDPINLMSYVVFVFMKVLGFPKEKATKHDLQGGFYNFNDSVVSAMQEVFLL